MSLRAILFLLLAPAVPAASIAGCGGTTPEEPPPTTCSIAAPALTDFRLHTDGTKLRDALGRAVVLRGVNAGGRAKFAPFAPFEYADGQYDAALATYLDRAASWGIDALRVPFTWAAVEPVEGMDDEAFLKRYDALLDGAWARGMYTIVDFHQDIYAEIYCGDGFPAWTIPGPHPAPHHDCPGWGTKYLSDPDIRAAFDAFWADGSAARASYEKLWDRIVARYKDRPGVIGFEVFNEPSPGTADSDAWESTTLTLFYTAMAARIHKTAPGALFFFDATGPDSVTITTSLEHPGGEGLVFAPHYYQPNALAGTEANPDSVRLDLQKWANFGRKWDVPVLLGEFGVTNGTPGAAEYMSAHFAAFDALGMSGTEWEYSVAKELWNAEDLSAASADGKEEPSAGAIIRPYARAVAGDDVVFSYDASSRKMDLKYAPAAGVTEIALPARADPSGFEVDVTGGCVDASKAGRLLVQASSGAASVEVHITSK